MNLCLNAVVIQFPDGRLDTCFVTAPRALLLPYAHRGHCKDEDGYKECWSHVEFSISLTRIRPNFGHFQRNTQMLGNPGRVRSSAVEKRWHNADVSGVAES